MDKEGMGKSIISVVILSIVVTAVVCFFIYNKVLIGPILLGLGFLPWIPLKIYGRSIKSVGADIVFGIIDTAILGVTALIGANFAGVLGAIVGGAVGDAISDAIAGLFEGKIAQVLRRYGIEEARTPLSSSMGKMSGCLLGIGFTLTIAWTIIKL
ncbi:MAG: hypothetical protein ISS43_00385 [Candidatus Omnitrophica bacterium]|nr:hypothetical protein [Candidatus Omnitrophota bacterium]